jgi:hypothetical protein
MKIFILVLVLTSLAVGPSWAAEKKPSPPVDDPMVPKIDKTFWRRMTPIDATSTSKCIGSRESPICVVETHLACRKRFLPELCRYALGEIDELPEKRENSNPRKAGYRLDYKVWYARRITARELPWPMGLWEKEPPDVQPQDVMMVIFMRFCHNNKCIPFTLGDPEPSQYVVRNTEKGWIITFWTPRGPVYKSMPFYYENFLPDYFRNRKN